MSPKSSNTTINQLFEHLHKILSSERFLKKQGLGNEVPFFICDYKPKQKNEIVRLQKQLTNKLAQAGINILNINLYDLSKELLDERGLWQQIIDSEKNISKDKLKELLQSVLDPADHLIPAITKKMEKSEFDIMFLTGVGEVFPYIRSHNILNNLQSAAESKPTVIFFPGEYKHSQETGASLLLFGRLQDDKYYRAFKISDYEI